MSMAPAEAIDDEQRPLRLSGSSALEVEAGMHQSSLRADRTRNPLLPLLSAVAALVVIIVCTWALIFGRWPAGRPQLSAACKQALAGTFRETLAPFLYNLSLSLPPALFSVDPSDPTGAPTEFSASVTITLDVRRPADCILLHAVGMRFLGASLAAAGAQEVQLCSSRQECRHVVVPVPPTAHPVQSSLDEGLVAVDLGGRQLQPGAAVLRLQYIGTLGLDMEGLHRSDPFVVCQEQAEGQVSGNVTTPAAATGTANSTRGVERTGSCQATMLLATQLEPTAARRMLPCFDGPRFKARFQVSLEVPSGLTALSNMPVLQRAPAPTLTGPEKAEMDLVVFETTPIMSPYLLAVVVGELRQLHVARGEGSNRTLADAPQVRLWAVPGKESQLRVSQAAAEGALSFFTRWTGVEQPLPKFDFVAVPGKGGAMENFGLLMFDEARFLVNEATEGAYGVWLAVDVVCHEVAHQWWGNLVTAYDWTQLTFNEGLASFMEYKCVEAIFPEIPAQALFFRATSPSAERLGIHEGPLQRALGFDSDPLLPPLVPASELQSVPGVIIYSKGAALLRLLEAFLEGLRPGFFQAALKALLQQRLYGTARVADLLAALAEQVAPSGTINPADAVPGRPADGQPEDGGLADFELLARQYAAGYSAEPAGDSSEGPAAGAGDDALAGNPLAAWLHQPGFPLLNFSDQGSRAVQQQRLCSWEPVWAEIREVPSAGSLGGSCSGQGGQQWWLPALALAGAGSPACLGQATSSSTLPSLAMACAASGGNSSGSSAEALCAWSPLVGAGLWRVAHSEQQLASLLEAVKGVGLCFLRANTSTHGQALLPPLIGSSSGSCGALEGEDCRLSAAPLLAAATMVADTFALAWPGQAYPAAWLLRAAEAAAKAPISSTGSGTHLLLLPAAEALLSLRPLLAANVSCKGRLKAFTTRLLAQHAARVLESSTAGQSVFSPGGVAADDFLGLLAAGRLAWQAALGGDTATSFALCSALPATPLWRWVSDAKAAGVGGGLACPPGFHPASSASASPSGAAPCERGEAGGARVPGALRGAPGPDLLPAIYIAAAAGAGTAQCQYLQDLGVTSGLVSKALQHCWEQEQDDAEASRCLHAVPFVGGEPELQQALAWLLRCPDPAAKEAGADVRPEALAEAVLRANRQRALPALLPTLLRNAAQFRVEAWQLVLQALQAVSCGAESTLCSALEQLPEPWSEGQQAQLEGAVAGCPADVRSRVLGRAHHLHRAASQAAASLCSFLAASP